MALAVDQEVAVVVLTQAAAVLAVLVHQGKDLLVAMEITALMLAVAVVLVLLALMPQPMLEAMAAQELLLPCQALQ
jgi:hypothetical protein